MSVPTMMQRAHAFLAERRRLGFKAHNIRYALFSFARHADRQHLQGPLTVECMSRLGEARQVAARQARDLGATTEAAAAVYPLVTPVRAAYRGA